MRNFDRAAIAARIRDIAFNGNGADPTVVARHLGVDEVGLRMSVDELAPNPTVEVIAAVVATYGVDPSWLLTGECDPAVHRNSLDDRESATQAVSRLMLPSSGPPRESGGYFTS